jgi:hypothetical protein
MLIDNQTKFTLSFQVESTDIKSLRRRHTVVKFVSKPTIAVA